MLLKQKSINFRIIILLSVFNIVKSDFKNAQNIIQLIRKIKRERNFETLILYNSYDESLNKACPSNSILKELEFPSTILSASNYCSLTQSNFKRKLLIYYCLDNEINFMVFKRFLKCLGLLRNQRVIFGWNIPASVNNSKTLLHTLLKHCQQSFVTNVISIFDDFSTTRTLYRYTPFPQFKIEAHNLSVSLSEKIYPNRFENLHQAKIRTLPDSSGPRCLTYANEEGVHVIGYIARIVYTFAFKHNATLIYPKPLKQNHGYSYWWVHNETISNQLDIPMSVTSPVRNSTLRYHSNIVEQATWFPIVPLANPTPVNKIYLLIISSRLTLILCSFWFGFSFLLTLERFNFHENVTKRQIIMDFILLSISLLNGMLGQSITMANKNRLLLKLIYTLLFMAGIFLSTTYNAYLQTFLTSSPKPREITTFDELLKSPFRVQILDREFSTLRFFTGNEFWEKYKNIFTVTPVEVYGKSRTSLDPHHAYMCTSSLWPVLDQQQARFARPRFHLSPHMYFTKGLYLGISQHEHSIYREALNTVIRQLQESGLLALWQRRSYDDMIEAGFLNVTRDWPKKEPVGMCLLDFYWVWWIYLGGIALSAFIFLIEQNVDKMIHFKQEIELSE